MFTMEIRFWQHFFFQLLWFIACIFCICNALLALLARCEEFLGTAICLLVIFLSLYLQCGPPEFHAILTAQLGQPVQTEPSHVNWDLWDHEPGRESTRKSHLFSGFLSLHCSLAVIAVDGKFSSLRSLHSLFINYAIWRHSRRWAHKFKGWGVEWNGSMSAAYTTLFFFLTVKDKKILSDALIVLHALAMSFSK